MTSEYDAEEARIRDAYARRQPGDRESWFNPAYRLMIQARESAVLGLLGRHGFARLADARILDVGCGKGLWLRDFVKWGARPEHLTGVDLLPDRIAAARTMCAPAVTLVCGNAAALDFPDGSFDIVVQATIFTSILDPALRQAVAAEMLRVVRRDGIVLWYDYYVDNPRNPDVRGVRRREVHSLFPGCRVDLERVTLAPPLARALAPYSPLACHLLEAVPFLRTHYLGVIRKDRA